MLWWVLGALALVVTLALAFSAITGSVAETDYERTLRLRRESRKNADIEDAKLADRRQQKLSEERAASIHAFEAVALRGWPFKRCKVGEDRAAIACEPLGQTFVIVRYKDWRTISVLSEAEYDVTEVMAVRTDRLSKSYDKKVVDYERVHSTKNKSAIGRGLAGALVAGPVGAIVGAVSAVTPTTAVEKVATVRFETIRSTGDSRVVLHMTDMGLQPLVMDFAIESQAQAVVAWIDARLGPRL